MAHIYKSETNYESESRSIQNMTLSQYVKMKIKMLEDSHGFGFTLTEEEKDCLKSLTSDIQVDNYCRKIIDKRFDKMVAPKPRVRKRKNGS